MWLPPGGHIEENELPHEAALREVREETGLHAVLLCETTDKKGAIEKEGVAVLPRPRYVLLEDIGEDHQHMDLIYFATAGSSELSPSHGESLRMMWFTREDIDGSRELTDDVKILAREALDAGNM